MKKHLLLIPSLVALSATPFIGLTSCFESEEDDPKPGPTPKKEDCLTFTALADTNFWVRHYDTKDEDRYYPKISYQIDNGKEEEYVVKDEEPDKILISEGQSIKFWGNNPQGFSYINEDDDNDYVENSFEFDNEGILSGNIMSLLYGKNFTGKKNMPNTGCFNSLFEGYDDDGAYDENMIVSAKDLVLPSTELTFACYEDMFSDCEYMQFAPCLPAQQLAIACYRYMFEYCGSLMSAPQLPAMKLADNCYERMFYGCDSLVSTPDLFAEELADNCYNTMFGNCDSLASFSELPAEQLQPYCYYDMFNNCHNITSTPKIRATTLEYWCCAGMFQFCESLKVRQSLELVEDEHLIFTCPEIGDADNPFCEMFSGVAAKDFGNPIPGYSYYWYE